MMNNAKTNLKQKEWMRFDPLAVVAQASEVF
jgi:hypothetical protein